MHLRFDKPGEQCFQYVESETKAQLLKRLVQEGRMQKPQDIDERTKDFFSDCPSNYLLCPLARGEDSRVYIFLEEGSERMGLVKLYNAAICPLLQIEKYRRRTQEVIDATPAINDALDTQITIQNEQYTTSIHIVPVSQPIERNGVVGMFIEDEDWIRGDDIYGSRTQIEHQLYESMKINDVTDRKGQRMYTIPYIKSDDRIPFLEERLTPLLREHLSGSTFWIDGTNVKMAIDHQRQEMQCIITDIADGIRRV